MQASFHPPSEICVSGDDQSHAAGPAQPRHLRGKPSAVLYMIVAEDDAAEPARELRDGGQRVRQALAVGKQPKDRQGVTRPVLYGAGP